MTTHRGPWQYDPAQSGAAIVSWVCAACAAVVGFVRPGQGDPSATEDACPDDVAEYSNKDCA